MMFARSLSPAWQGMNVRTFGLFAVAVAAVFGGLVFFSRPAAAATCNFRSVGNNNFNTSGNWSCGAVPTAADDVLVGAGTTTNLSASVTVSNVSVSGTLNAVASLLQVTTSTSIDAGGVVTSTSGILALNTVTSTGSLGTLTGIITVSSTFQNNGYFGLAGGTATTTGAFTNAVSGRINGGGGILAFLGDYLDSGAFTAATGTVRVGGTANQNIAGELYNLFVSLKTEGTATFAASTTILSTLNANGAGGTVSGGSTALTVVGAATVLSGASVSSTSGTLTFNAAVTSTGSLGSTSGNMQLDSTLQNNGWFAIGSGTSTFADTVTNAVSGTINNNTGVLRFAADFTNAGTFNANTGTTRYIDYGAANNGNVAAVTYYNLIIDKDDGFVATLTGGTTVSNAFTLSLGILSVNTRTFTVSGTYTNSGGQVTISSGTIVHALTSNAFTTSSGGATSTAQITFTSGGGLYVTLQDNNRNLSATNTETMTVTASVTSASGSDSETLTLTETGNATGIFRNTTAFPLSYVVNATTNDGTLTVNASDTGTVSYTDTYDATDTGTDTITITLATSAPAGTTTTGGGGLAAAGGGGSSGLVPVTTEFQEVVVDGAVIPVHTLVKLVCPAGAGVNHPCTAVYYVSTQGKRHAFPNAKVYFTWYPDFSGVQLINETQMAGIPLGMNVTYKPGVKMVKFTTDLKVYAVEKGGNLRWVTSEALAIALYGTAWNTMIDDIDDAFYVNYRFGNDISSTADYNPATAKASVTYPSDSLQR
ncbi:MAG: hypothetical protein AAB668_00515 [Patescibacteria group bacterium]